ncbi:hypothetical protein J1D01_08720 [Seonamhaeicola sp. NFXS20]|uniref:hypothetical protein n=1 Tax=Seonamhaeicola sp. NFXS20 TaxID=2816959 RepID=UPI003B8D51CD
MAETSVCTVPTESPSWGFSSRLTSKSDSVTVTTPSSSLLQATLRKSTLTAK